MCVSDSFELPKDYDPAGFSAKALQTHSHIPTLTHPHEIAALFSTETQGGRDTGSYTWQTESHEINMLALARIWM
jgi:hypothetical protein